MNTESIIDVARASYRGTITFPEVVRDLLAAGVEYYLVDYAAMKTTYYGEAGGRVALPLPFENMPAIAAAFDAAALRAAILDSQHGQKFRDFSRRAAAAGTQGYYAFLRGQRVIYFGRQGDQHTEWFPGAEPQSSNS